MNGKISHPSLVPIAGSVGLTRHQTVLFKVCLDCADFGNGGQPSKTVRNHSVTLFTTRQHDPVALLNTAVSQHHGLGPPALPITKPSDHRCSNVLSRAAGQDMPCPSRAQFHRGRTSPGRSRGADCSGGTESERCQWSWKRSFPPSPTGRCPGRSLRSRGEAGLKFVVYREGPLTTCSRTDLTQKLALIISALIRLLIIVPDSSFLA